MKINKFVILYWIPETGGKKKNTLEENWRNSELDVSIVTANLGKTSYKFNDKEFLIGLPFYCVKTFPKNYSEKKNPYTYSVQFTSVAQSCPTLCNPKNSSTSGLPVHRGVCPRIH